MSKDIGSQCFPLLTDIIYNISIDSLKIRIPISYVNPIDLRLRSSVIYELVDILTGEIQELNIREKMIRYEKDGIHFRVSICKLSGNIGTKLNDMTEYLVLEISSKILTDIYFDGITFENIKLIYDRLISLNIVEIDYNAFLIHSKCIDIDFKVDIMNIENIDDALNGLSVISKIKPSFSKREKVNKGIQFGHRIGDSTISKPFSKFYWKYGDLISKSKVFTDRWIPHLLLKHKNTIRYETTIKNKKHLKKFNITDSSLSNLLQLSDEKKTEIIHSSLKSHLDLNLSSKLNSKILELSISEWDKFDLISMKMEKYCCNTIDAIKLIIESRKYKTKQQKNIHKKQLEKVIQKSEKCKVDLNENMKNSVKKILGNLALKF